MWYLTYMKANDTTPMTGYKIDSMNIGDITNQGIFKGWDKRGDYTVAKFETEHGTSSIATEAKCYNPETKKFDLNTLSAVRIVSKEEYRAKCEARTANCIEFYAKFPNTSLD